MRRIPVICRTASSRSPSRSCFRPDATAGQNSVQGRSGRSARRGQQPAGISANATGYRYRFLALLDVAMPVAARTSGDYSIGCKGVLFDIRKVGTLARRKHGDRPTDAESLFGAKPPLLPSCRHLPLNPPPRLSRRLPSHYSRAGPCRRPSPSAPAAVNLELNARTAELHAHN